MSAVFLEPIPHTDTDALRMYFEDYGQANISGLVDPSVLGPAIADAGRLSSPLQTHNRGKETITHLRTPDPKKEAALHAILQGMQRGALLLNQSVLPALPGERLRIDLWEMEQGIPETSRSFGDSLVGAVAMTNLSGESYQQVYSEEGKRRAYYQIRPGDIIIHGLGKRSQHRNYTSFGSEQHMGLVAATIAPPAPEITR